MAQGKENFIAGVIGGKEEKMNEKTNNLQTEEKMFTQSDLNRIISERLSRDKQKSGDDLDKREIELTERELKLTAKQVFMERGIPVELAEIVKLTDEKSIENAVNVLEKYVTVSKEKNKLSVENERKLPQSREDDSDYGQLRKAFGLN